MICRFGEFELDEDVFELRRGGRPVAVEPKVFNVLAYLVHHRDRVVPKDELFEQLWPGEFVSDSALTSCIKALRKAVGDDGTSQAIIKTLHGRGYRFVADIMASAPSVQPAGLSTRDSALSTDFVGRERELQQITAGLDEVRSGRGRMVLLVGEPGIGKTRTAEEVAAVARQRAALVLVGRCFESDGAPAFWPWIQVVRAYLRGRDAGEIRAALGSGAADIAHLVPELCDRFPHVSPPPLDTEQARFRLFDSLTRFLKTAAEHQPLVLVLDDLHWADKASLALLEFMAREIAEVRILVLGTYRDVEVGSTHPLTHTLGELARVRSCQRIVLRGLAAADVGRFMEQAAGCALPAELVSAVHAETEGNPFFVTEIVRLLAASGELLNPAHGQSWRLTIPQSVREAIGRRLSRLSDTCNRTLQGAAVIGREFSLSVLKRASEGERKLGSRQRSDGHTTVLEALDEAVAARVVEPLGQSSGLAGFGVTLGRYRFSHALIRETLYDALSVTDRTRWHRAVGEALEDAHHASLDTVVDEIAHHFFQAAPRGNAGKAIRYAVRAGAHSAATFAYEKAAAHYERAVQLLELDEPSRGARCDLLLAWGDNLWRAGDVASARDVFTRAAAVAEESGAADHYARAALGYGGGFRGFDLGVIEPELVAFLERANDRLPPTDSALRAQVLARLAVALYHVPDSLARRQSLSQAAVAMTQRLGDRGAQFGAFYSRHWAIWGPENLDDRIGAANAMVELADALGDREMALHAHRFRLIDALEQGDIATVDSHLAACAAVADELRQPYYLWYVATFRAMRAFVAGEFTQSEQLAQQALAIGQRAQSRNVAQTYAVQMMWLRREQGRLVEVEPALRSFVEQYPTLPSWRCGHAWVLSEMNRAEEARAQFEVLAVNDFGSIPHNAFWLVACTVLGDVCAYLGDARRAHALYELLTPYARRNVEVTLGATCMGSTARSLGRLAATLGRWDVARAHFEDALRMDSGLRAPHLVAHTQRDYAEALVSAGQPADLDKALEMTRAAAITYERLAMHEFHARAALIEQGAREGRRAGRSATGTQHARVTLLRPRR